MILDDDLAGAKFAHGSLGRLTFNLNEVRARMGEFRIEKPVVESGFIGK